MIRTYAPQLGHVAAAGALACGLGGGAWTAAWNASVAPTMDSFRTRKVSTTVKRPARHLGDSTT